MTTTTTMTDAQRVEQAYERAYAAFCENAIINAYPTYAGIAREIGVFAGWDEPFHPGVLLLKDGSRFRVYYKNSYTLA